MTDLDRADQLLDERRQAEQELNELAASYFARPDADAGRRRSRNTCARMALANVEQTRALYRVAVGRAATAEDFEGYTYG